ncbi:peptidoglycan-binding protein [Tabrizicola sp.]|uniref:peptidoglycan-binding domain-containing protein n=1 Tax=Tabrizicola sp. TaxID=2005166 RepID=UPI002733A233|nr:peptidoglycan-binding protein [Tabrizicola sp.]MDP3194955.1 peptidoglycan-binding protein [Tabrizicola sp.]
MRTFTLPLALAAGLGLTAPAPAQNLEDVIGGIAQTLIQQELDKNAYLAAQEANTAAAYRDYLAKFPKGAYRVNAERALERLGASTEASSAAQAEARLGITFAQKVGVQRELTRLGYRTYGTDGVWGKNTRTAIATWQRDRGDKVTGYVTEAQLRLLLRGAVVTTPPADDGGTVGTSPVAVEAALKLTRTQRVEIQRQLSALGFDTGVADGLWGAKTRTAIKAWQRANRQTQTGYVTAAQVKLIRQQAGSSTPTPGTDNEAALEESLLGLTRTERVDLQRRLTRLGYETLRTDGTFGPGTRRAIAEWQADEGEPATGYLTADQVRLIRVETGG